MTDSFELAFGEEVFSSSNASYKNFQRLGTGGNATTYLMAARTGPHRGVSFGVKFFRRLSKPEWKEGFLREPAFLKTCDHPAIMRYFDEGIARDQNPFFVAEYLPRTLRGVIASGTASVVEKLSYSVQLLSALTYLANLDKPNQPVIHRDIKPNNIFIKGQSCVLGDFGLIKFIESVEGDREFIKESLGPGPQNCLILGLVFSSKLPNK